MSDTVTAGDCYELVKGLPDASVSLTITSPPYYRQRTYTEDCREVGREGTPDEYVGRLVEIFNQCVRVTRPDGSIVFNLGDKYESGSLLLLPWQFARAVTTARLINQVTWVKTNPTPRQYTKRMVSSTEPFFHFVNGPNYKYYLDRLAAPKSRAKAGAGCGRTYYGMIDASDLEPWQKELAREELSAAVEEVKAGAIDSFRMKIRGMHSLPFGGQPGGRMTQLNTKGFTIIRLPGRSMVRDVMESPVGCIPGVGHPAIYPAKIVEDFIRLTTDEGDVVFDPFAGSGTTRKAARELGRQFVGFELNEEFVRLANQEE